jgi:hypothetical protein
MKLSCTLTAMDYEEGAQDDGLPEETESVINDEERSIEDAGTAV